MQQRIAHIALVVEDYDDAIEFHTQKLDFTLLEDKNRWQEKMGNGCATRSERMLPLTCKSY